MADEDEKAKETRLREMAQHRGFKLIKSRRRKPGGDFEKYGLTDASGAPCLGVGAKGLEAGAEEILDFLRGRTEERWKGSLKAVGEPEASRSRKSRGRGDPESRAEKDKAAAPRAERSAPARPVPAPAPAPPPPPLLFRKARTSDAPAILALLQAAGEIVSSDRLDGEIRASAKRKEAWLVAEQEALIGFAAWHVLPLPHRPPIGRILAVFVVPERRRGGIGQALVEAAVAELTERGCETIEMIGPADFGEISRFARKLGFDGRDYRFTRGEPQAD